MPTTAFLWANAANYRPRRPGYVVSYLVNHTTEGRTLGGAVDWFRNPASGVSAHYVIDTDGDIVQMVPDHMCAIHAGSPLVRGFNDMSIGVEHVGFAGDGVAPPEPQLRASAMVAAKMRYDFGIAFDRRHFIGHSEVPHDPATPFHTDPGIDWPWDRYMAYVAEAFSARSWERR